MICKPYNHYTEEQYNFGKQKETELLPVIEKALGESVIPTVNRYNKVDFVSENYNIEVKSRTGYSTAFNTWLVPVNKFKDQTKKLAIIYHWSKDNSNWLYIFDPNDVNAFIVGEGPNSRQEHYNIPKHFFNLII